MILEELNDNLVSSKVIIILASYNGGQYISEQIQSILNQTFSSFKLFIFDDCSTDNTVKLVEKFCKLDSRISLIKNKKNTGNASSNFLQALRYIHQEDFDFIMLADQDDIWHKDKIQKGLEKMLSSPSTVNGYSCSWITFNEDIEKGKYFNKALKQKKYDHFFESASSGCTYLFDRDVYDKVIEVSANYSFAPIYHDWFIYFVAKENGLGWFIDERAFIYYRQHQNNEFGSGNSLAGKLFRLKLLFSNKWFEALNANLALNNIDFSKLDFIKIANLFEFRRNNSHSVLVFLYILMMKILSK